MITAYGDAETGEKALEAAPRHPDEGPSILICFADESTADIARAA